MSKIIFGNWKMNKTIKETNAFCDSINLLVNNKHEKNLIGIAPSFTCLQTFKNKTKLIHLIAQNVSEEVYGAKTSQISVLMLKDIGVEYCLLGHSEVRQYLNETDNLINKKIKLLLKNDIIPILCIGETEKQFEGKETKQILKKQIEDCLIDISSEEINKIIIAYEPIWAIGTGKTASNELIDETIKFIKKCVSKHFNIDNINVLYGGSVNENNAKEILNIKNVDGVLVGGASLDPQKFFKIINYE